MKKRFIAIANFVVAIAMFVGIAVSATLSKNNYVKVQQDLFQTATISSEETLSNYLKLEQQVVNSWSKYIGSRNMEIDEAFDYLRGTLTGECYSVHIVDKTNYEGFTSKPSAANPSDFSLVYPTGGDSDSAQAIIRSAIVSEGNVNMLPCFSDICTGIKVVGFCQNVDLYESGVRKDGLIIRYFQQDSLSERWKLNPSLTGSYCGVIDLDGRYVIKPVKMKFSSFYEFIYTYNRNGRSPDEIKAFMVLEKNGSFIASDMNGRSTFYSFALVQDGNDDIILIDAVEVSTFQESTPAYILAFVVLAVLVCLLIVNLLYFYSVRKADKKMRVALEAALEQSKAASKAKSTFLHNMSHDIRTPMNAIIGYTTIAQENITNQERVESSLQKIALSSQHLLGLINDVLDMSRIESGKLTLDYKEHNIGEIMHGIKSIVHANIGAKGLSLYSNTVNVEHLNILCDKVCLNQILINLLSNAIKFTEAGGHISILVEELPYQNDNMANFKFTVQDDGIGMSPEFLERLFEEFERERTSTVSATVGTGLGMSITKHLVELMGGRIEVESEKGKGTKFDVYLSFEIAENGVTTDYSITELIDSRALIVDDDYASCESVSKMLSSIGVRSEWTLYGREAVLKAKDAHASQNPYDVFIIDWILGDTNGIEVVKQIRQVIGDDAPIIVLTAYDFTNIQDEAKKAGVTCFLSKPLFIDDLTESLKGALRKEPVAAEEEKEETKYDGKRCLLVEDNELNREIATFFLEGHGLLVETAENGKEAVERVLANPSRFDVVFMDIQMPVMNGYEATDAIRASRIDGTAEIKIIAMTANSFKEDIDECMAHGMNGFIPKPLDTDSLNKALEDLFSKGE